MSDKIVNLVLAARSGMSVALEVVIEGANEEVKKSIPDIVDIVFGQVVATNNSMVGESGVTNHANRIIHFKQLGGSIKVFDGQATGYYDTVGRIEVGLKPKTVHT